MESKSIISTWTRYKNYWAIWCSLFFFFQMKPSKFDVNFALRKHISLEQLHFQSSVIPQGHQLPYIRQQIFRLLVGVGIPTHLWVTQTSWLIGWRSMLALSRKRRSDVQAAILAEERTTACQTCHIWPRGSVLPLDTAPDGPSEF